MSEFTVNIKHDTHRGKKSSYTGRGKDWLLEKTMYEQLQNPIGYVLFILIAAFIGVVAAKGGLAISLALVVAIVGAPVMLASIFYMKFGVILLLTLSFTILGVKRMVGDPPVGIALDAVTAALFLGLLIRVSRERDLSFLKSSVTVFIVIWIFFNILQFFNPDAVSRMAWVYTVRGFAGIMVVYFILMYVMNDMRYVKMLTWSWIGLALFGALYGLFQDYVGLRGFEWRWLASDMERFSRYDQWGQVRKWSMFSDPVVFGFLMAYSSVVSVVLSTAFKQQWIKIALWATAFIMFLAMLTTGTRAAYVLPFAALGFYVLMNLTFRSFAIAAVIGVMGVVLITIPTENVQLVRFQSAFSPTEDASYEVRVRNQQFIQPFIQSHPMGGGLGSTGIWGQRFAPDSPLSQFPPDSGFVRIAVETGWVGLFLFMALLFVIIVTGVRNYYRIRSPEIKSYHLAFLLTVIMLVVASYPQEAITSPPSSVIFYICVAGMIKLVRIDKEKHQNEKLAEHPKSEVAS